MKKTLLSMAFAFAALATGGLNAAEVTDVLTVESLKLTATSYAKADFSDIQLNSSAVYAGNALKGNNPAGTIQLNKKDANGTGIVTTASGGTVTKIVVGWHDETDGSRNIKIYGSNTPYSSGKDLYNSATQGTLIGSLQKGETELVVEGDFQYFGIYPSGALYLNEIQVTWETGGEVLERVEAPTFSVAPRSTMPSTAKLSRPARQAKAWSFRWLRMVHTPSRHTPRQKA